MLHYILDGYNIIKSDDAAWLFSGSLQAQRERLIHLIVQYHPQGSERNRITVVFDGSGSPDAFFFDDRYHVKGVEVMFSRGESADDTIVALVESLPQPSQSVVVTNDRSIHRLLAGRNVRFLSVAQFAEKLTGRS